MSKIVIPKHSADIDELNAVLKIHYDAKDWVKSADFKKQLMGLIGSEQYPSSYPKKAQVPAYFGFLESHISSGGKITERRITPSGIEMYEAILAKDRGTCQRLILEALEKMIFGRNNAGCVSSDSDVEAPAILVKCILDTGYCTSSEYAYLVWALNDKCKKYYESLANVIIARETGGIVVSTEASDYKDWKPVLAMLRWGFLIKSNDSSQKVLLHPEVIEKYSDRLQRLVVYNIDKHDGNNEVDFDDISIENESNLSYKPFKIDDANLSQIQDGHFLQACDDIEEQKILIEDEVLLVDRQITCLVAYYSFLVKRLEKVGNNYNVNIQRRFAINKSKEEELVTALKAEENLSGRVRTQNIIKSLMKYEGYEIHMRIDGKSNKDILPAYLVLKAILQLKYLTDIEQDYLVYSIVNDKKTYSDVICTIDTARKKGDLEYATGIQGYSHLQSIQSFKEKGIFEENMYDGKQVIQLNSVINDRYIEMLRRLSFYAVDIEKRYLSEKSKEKYNLPQIIKGISICKMDEMSKRQGEIHISFEQLLGQELVQGDFVVFLDEQLKTLQVLYVFQIVECRKKKQDFDIIFQRRYVINPTREKDIIQMIREA